MITLLLLRFINLAFADDWETVSVYSDLPQSRSGHSLITYNGQLYLFGGCDLGIMCYNDLQIYSADKKIWEVTTTVSGDIPEAREGHIAVLVGKFMYIHGGSSLTEVLNDVYKLNMQTLEWQEVEMGGKADARAYHAGVLHDNGLIFLFGGYTEKGLSQEILLIDTINKHWGHPVTVGTIPKARKYHSLNRIDDKVWMFGGETSEKATNELWYYDLYGRHWYEITASGAPPARHGHTATTHGSGIYIFGGCDNYKRICFADLYHFDGIDEIWQQLSTSLLIEGREALGMSFIGAEVFIFGGRFLMEKVYGDFWVYLTDEPCPADCSGHGTCTDIGCVCDSTWSGSDCSIENVCRLNCNTHGSCIEFECICYPGYYGAYCQGTVGCPNNCTSGLQGVCLDSALCECYDGFTSKDCSLKEDWKLCEDLCDNGYCEDLECLCDEGWVGDYCDIEAPVIYSASQDVSDLLVTSSVDDAEATDADSELSIESSVDVELRIKPSSEIDMSTSSFGNLTSVQDVAADILEEETSPHYLIPEMFGFTDPDDPTAFYAENLRREPEENEKEEWIEDLEEKQEDRQSDIESCFTKCSFHGVCYSAICYCESGYTGENCEIPEEDIDKGIEFSKALIGIVCVTIVGCCAGGYYLNKIMKQIKHREESKVNEVKDDDDDDAVDDE